MLLASRPERWFSYPYGGSYQRRGNLPYVNPYYGSYYASPHYRDYRNYRSPYYR